MGSYHYHPDSLLTRWQQEKVWELCGERHPILERKYAGKARPTDKALLRHIERQIDWYQMKEAKPGLDNMQAINRCLRTVGRALVRLEGLRSGGRLAKERATKAETKETK